MDGNSRASIQHSSRQCNANSTLRLVLLQVVCTEGLPAVSWYPHRNDDGVLWLHYDDLSEDLTKCISLISNFLQIGVGDDELLKIVEEQVTS